MSQLRLCLKVDCDTYEGTRDGVPSLLKVFDEFNVRATFFFTLGPDTTGRAIFRVFTRKGFLKKMLERNAVSVYGLKTTLYGTLLPPPHIGKKLKDVMRTVQSAGHEVGIHGWDHIRWHDKADRMSDEQIRRDYGRAHAMFQDIFGVKAVSSAAPGWNTSPTAFKVYDALGMTYVSDTRGGNPCFIRNGGGRFNTLEIPSTLPTWDEVLPTDVEACCDQLAGTSVHSIHAEMEGAAVADLFKKQLSAWKSRRVGFMPLRDYAAELLRNPSDLPVKSLKRAEIPDRTGLVTTTA